jgi:membrane protein implicated in regulation of membrane protease activity
LSRNLVIVVSGAIFLLTRQWMALAVILTVALALPAFDMSVLLLSGVTPPALHPTALVLIAISAALIWRRAAASRTQRA